MRVFKVVHDILTTPMGAILSLSLSINYFDVAWYACTHTKKRFQKSSGNLSTDLFIVHPVQIIRKNANTFSILHASLLLSLHLVLR